MISATPSPHSPPIPIEAEKRSAARCQGAVAKPHNPVKMAYMATLQTMALARLSWTLSLALNAGIDANRAVRMALASTQNRYYTQHIDKADAVIMRHGQFHEALRATGASYTPVARFASWPMGTVDRRATQPITQLCDQWITRWSVLLTEASLK